MSEPPMTAWLELAATRVELRALVDEYAARADARDYHGLSELFEPDGYVCSSNPGELTPFFEARGRAELAGLLRGNDQFVSTFHFVGNHQCRVEGTTASGVTYCSARHLQDWGSETRALVMHIRYHDGYRRTDGEWRFTTRRIEMVWVEYADADSSPYPFREGSSAWMDS